MPVFQPGHACVLKVHNAVAHGTRNNDELVQRNYKLAAQVGERAQGGLFVCENNVSHEIKMGLGLERSISARAFGFFRVRIKAECLRDLTSRFS